MEPSTALNGDAASSSSTKVMSPSRQQAKSPYSKAGDNSLRKPLAAAPDDGAQKRTAAPTAWTGMNPITKRTMTPTHANGAAPTPKSSTPKSGAAESLSHEKLAADRVAHLLSSLVGLQVQLNTKNGDAFTGVFAGHQLDNHESSYLLKMVRQTSKLLANGSNHDELEYVGAGPDHAMTFGTSEVTSLLAKNVPEVTTNPSQNGTASGFRTDSDIAGNAAVRERHLQKWVSPAQGGADMSLEPAGNWDQFAANEQQFGVKSDYDENLYTTRIDKSNPLYPMRLAEADRIAREIEAEASTNTHMREERGQGEDDGADEEEKYSGVRRNGPEYPPLQSSNPNRYMPPARRSANSKNVAAGSSVDPAIISSQIARSSPKAQEAPAPAPVTENKINADSSSDAVKTSELKLATQAKPIKEVPARPTLTIAPKPLAVGTTATKNVEANVRDAFHQFANEEKLKVQDSRRSRASADKAIKINDLVKFSKNFKLSTPIPKDLVPILAKDKTKQENLVEKAHRNAQLMAGNPNNAAASTAGKPLLLNGTDAKAGSKATAAARHEHDPNHPSAKLLQQQHASRSRPPVPPDQVLSSTQLPLDHTSAGSGLLGHRLADGHRMHKLGNQNVPAPLPIQDVRKRSSGAGVMNSTPSPQRLTSMRSPTSAKLNVNAPTFKPNPAANSFKPIDPSGASSPQSGRTTQPVSRPQSPSEFFGSRKPIPPSERPSILDHFNPLAFLKAEAEKEGKTQEYQKNGGIKNAFKTPPIWSLPQENEEFKSYKDVFAAIPPPSGPQHPSPNSQPLPHAHQLPPHLQGNPGIPQVHAPHGAPPSMPTQMHHYNQQHPHDEHFHSMRQPASNSSVYPAPSPRVQNMTMPAYPSSPMNQHAQLAYGQPAPPYYMGMATNGHPVAFRPYPGGSPMVSQGAHLAAPMMVQQPGNGGMMGMPQPMGIAFNPQLAMYPGGHPQAYVTPHQPPNGYPSPGRAAPMMMHQGSHQGQHHPGYAPPNQYGQPLYAQQQQGHLTPLRSFASPQPPHAQNAFGHQYPHQPHRTPSSGYAQLPQVHHQHLGSQQGPPQGPTMDLIDSTK